jgi:hypothetical protein
MTHEHISLSHICPVQSSPVQSSRLLLALASNVVLGFRTLHHIFVLFALTFFEMGPPLRLVEGV